MKTFFKSNEIAHVWANKGAPEGRCPSSMSFNSDAFYSYGTVIARRITYRGREAYIIDNSSFSCTTTQHQSAVRDAISNAIRKFYVYSGRRGQQLDFTPAELRDHFVALYKEPASDSKYAHKRAQDVLTRYARLKTAIEVCEYFGLPHKKLLKLMDKGVHDRTEAEQMMSSHHAKLNERRRIRDEKERLERERLSVERAERVIAGVEDIDDFYVELDLPDSRPDLKQKIDAIKKSRYESDINSWLNGSNKQFRNMHKWPTLLRLESVEVVTTKGARVPIADARRTFEFVMKVREKGWRRNGEQHAVGMYQLDSVTNAGLVAGCHHVLWDEIERFARQQGWM